MPKNKDLKRLVRARMARTGESYTAARAHIVKSESVVDATPETLPLPEDYETLAGMSNEAVQRRTGRTWPEWATWLDERKAYEWEHPKIASHLDEAFDFGGWWAQMVTVSYERFRGLRDVGQRRDGGYDANRSRTIPVSLARLYEAFTTDEARAGWIGETDVSIHRQTLERSMRGRTAEGHLVAFYFTEKGPEKSSVSVQVGGLPDREMMEAEKAVWGERLDRLKAHLSG